MGTVLSLGRSVFLSCLLLCIRYHMVRRIFSYCKSHYGVSLTIWGLAILGIHSCLAEIQTGLGFSLCAALPILLCPDALSPPSRFSRIFSIDSLCLVGGETPTRPQDPARIWSYVISSLPAHLWVRDTHFLQYLAPQMVFAHLSRP